MDIVINPVDARTLETAVQLLKRQLNEHDIFTPEDDVRTVTRKIIEEPAYGFMLLASSGDVCCGIGYAAAHLSAEHGAVIGWLEELYVAPEWRNQGVGSELMQQILDRARAEGWRALELEVVAGHERAVPLYARHGFAPLSRTRFSRMIEP